MLERIVATAPVFLLVAVRCFALIRTTPLLSSSAVPGVAKVALAGFAAYLVLPSVESYGWNIDANHLSYIFLLLGEALIGVITGFYITMIYAAFSSAGQFFSLQMGFSAAESYDALSQVENPLMGQYLNLVAMLVFLQIKGFQTLFVTGVTKSFSALNAVSMISGRERFLTFLLKGLTELFLDAMMISLPMIASLFLVTTSMGILSKAAPQMNLLSEGLPITILVTFFLLTQLIPVMTNFFAVLFDRGFEKIATLFTSFMAGTS